MGIYEDIFMNDFSEFEPLFVGDKFRRVTFGKKMVVCEAEDYGKKLFYVKNGTISALVLDENGKEVYLTNMPSGTIIPLNSFAPEELYLANKITLRAVTITEAIEFEPAVLKRLIKEHPGFSMRCFEFKVKEENLLLYKLVGFSIWDSQRRVCESLATLVEYTEKKEGKGNNLRWSQNDLAVGLGLSRGQLGRVLKMLKEKGIIKTTRNMIIVLDKDKLKNMFKKS